MHTLSVLLGFATIVIPRWITFYLGALLFAIFGAKMLWEGWHMSTEEEAEEFDEVSEELKRKDQVGGCVVVHACVCACTCMCVCVRACVSVCECDLYFLPVPRVRVLCIEPCSKLVQRTHHLSLSLTCYSCS